jgi:hypothetical protein
MGHVCSSGVTPWTTPKTKAVTITTPSESP